MTDLHCGDRHLHGEGEAAHVHTCVGPLEHWARVHSAVCEHAGARELVTWPVVAAPAAEAGEQPAATYARKWAGDEGDEAAPPAAPLVIASSDDQLTVPEVAGVVRMVKTAEAAGWTVAQTYAAAYLLGTSRKAGHTKHTIVLRLARFTEVNGETVGEGGYVMFAREDRDGSTEPGKWGFAEALIDGKPYGARAVAVRLGDSASTVAARRQLAAGTPLPEPVAPAKFGSIADTLRALDNPPPPVPGTWGAVHAGDVLQGLDGRGYEVRTIAPSGRWVGSGVHEVRVELVCTEWDEGALPLILHRPATDPAGLARPADHTAEAQAAGALIEAGITPQIIEESTVPVIDALAALPLASTPCSHPVECRSTLRSGVVRCTACGADLPTVNGVPVLPGEDGHLPGTWEGADFTGGQDEVRPPATAVTVVREPAPPAVPSGADEFAAPAEAVRRFRSSRAKFADEDGVEHDRFGQYILPDPVTGEERLWTRASTLAKVIEDTWNLSQWGKRMVAKGMALRPDLVRMAASLDPEDDGDKGKLDKIAEDAAERAGATAGRNSGTGLHDAIKARMRGKVVELPPEMERDVQAAGAELARHHIAVDPALCERVIIVHHLGVAGRIDLIGQQPAVGGNKPFVIVDYKTTKPKSLDYSWDGFSTQEAIYSQATHMWDPQTQSWVDLSQVPIDRERGIILHAPVGAGAAYAHGIDLIAGWRKAQLCRVVKTERNQHAGHWLLSPPDPSALLALLVSKAASQQELAALWDRGQREGSWSADVQAAAAARWDELAAAGVIALAA